MVYGWPAMQSVLEREGVYGGLCPGEPISKCNKATIKFNEIFNAGSFAATGGGIVFGMLFDRFGVAFLLYIHIDF